MFALLLSMPRFKSIIFYQNSPKIKLFMQKNAKNFRALGAPLPDLQPPAVGGLAPGPLMAFGGSAPRLPKQLPSFRILATDV